MSTYGTRPNDCVKPPRIGSKDHEGLLKWVNEDLSYQHPMRSRDHSRWRRSELYDACAQNLARAASGYDEGGGVSQWVDTYWYKVPGGEVPRPVLNEGVGPRRNESSRLGRPNYRPTTEPRSMQPDIKALDRAMNTRRMLIHRLKEMEWPAEFPVACYHLPLYGGVFVGSWWDQPWDKTSPQPVQGAVWCKPCGYTLASPDIPFNRRAQATAGKENVDRAPVGGWAGPENSLERKADGSASAKACPQCGGKLTPYALTFEEQRTDPGRLDSLGRPLMADQPVGNWVMKILSPYDVFPANMGFFVRPGAILPDVSWCHPETLDWVALRYPKRAKHVKPENPATLAKFHPIAGQPDLLGQMASYTRSGGRNFKGCVRVKERHKAPWMEWVDDPSDPEGGYFELNRGRSVVMAGNEVLLDAPYLMDSVLYPGDTLERFMVTFIPWEYRDGAQRTGSGLGMWDILFDPQDLANERRGQRASVNSRLAKPIIAVARTANFELQALEAGVPAILAEFDVDPASPESSIPRAVLNETIDPGVNVEIQDTVGFMDRASDNAKIESADPGAVDAAAAIKLLKEAAGEKREDRIKRIKTGLRPLFGHGSRLMAGLYLEKRDMSFVDDDMSGEEQSWTQLDGSQLGRDGVDIVVDLEPDAVDTDEKRLQVKDLMDTGLIIPPQESPKMRRRLARFIAPQATDLYEPEDTQERAAEREWVDWRDRRKRPVLDPRLDDHDAHGDSHGQKAMTDYFRDLEERGNWDGALKVLQPTWDEDLRMLGLTPPIPPMPAVPGGVATPAGPMELGERIAAHWLQKLAAASQLQYADPFTGQVAPLFTPPKDIQALKDVIEWRAHEAAHTLFLQKRQMLAQMAMAPALAPAAPGAEETAAGTQVAPGAPAAVQAPLPGPQMAVPGQPAVPGMVP
jgi:hypothetical protein